MTEHELDLSVETTLDLSNVDPSKDGIDHIRINYLLTTHAYSIILGMVVLFL